MHQAPASVFELTPLLAIQDNTLNFNGGGKIEQTGPVISVKAEYGFNETLSAGLIFSYMSLSGKVSPAGSGGDQKGLSDPSLYLNGRVGTGNGSFRFGTLLSFNLDKEKIDSNLNSNASTGGMHAEPFLGYEMYFGTSTVGARLAYNFQLNDRKYTDSSSGTDVDKTVSGGGIIKTTLFYELAMDPATLGFAFDLVNTAKSTYKTDSTGSSRDSSPSTNWDLQLYVPVLVAPNVEILPKVTYGQYSAYDTSSYDSITQWSLEFGARITL